VDALHHNARLRLCEIKDIFKLLFLDEDYMIHATSLNGMIAGKDVNEDFLSHIN